MPLFLEDSLGGGVITREKPCTLEMNRQEEKAGTHSQRRSKRRTTHRGKPKGGGGQFLRTVQKQGRPGKTGTGITARMETGLGGKETIL